MPDFDVFLSHNSADKPLVRELAEALRGRGLRVWLDESELLPGRPWQEAIEAGIENSKTMAVCIGTEGLGKWETPEMRVAVQRHVEEQLPVIPVLLAGAPDKPELPAFLKLLTWVDLRGGVSGHGFERLMRGIEGEPFDGSEAKAQSRRRRWVWRCTPETEEALVPSVLAVVETVAAMVAYMCLAVTFDTYAHLAISAAIAPLLLLRTTESTRRGLIWLITITNRTAGSEGNLAACLHYRAKVFHKKVVSKLVTATGYILVITPIVMAYLTILALLVDMGRSLYEAMLLALSILLFAFLFAAAYTILALAVMATLALPLWLYHSITRAPRRIGTFDVAPLSMLSSLLVGIVLIRLLATGVSMLCAPILTAQAPPRNWWRISICVDGCHVPEIIPDVELSPWLKDLSYSHMIKAFRCEFTQGVTISILLYVPLSLAWLIAWLYRFSIKGTSLIWLPLIWAVNPARGDKVGPRGVLHDVRYGLISQLARWYSVFIFGVAVFKVLLFLNWPTWQSWWLQYAPELIHKVIAPTALPAWQIAALINTIGLWVLTFWADRAVRHPTLYTEATIDKVLRSTLTVRRLVTLFTTVSVLWILIEVAELGRVLG